MPGSSSTGFLQSFSRTSNALLLPTSAANFRRESSWVNRALPDGFLARGLADVSPPASLINEKGEARTQLDPMRISAILQNADLNGHWIAAFKSTIAYLLAAGSQPLRSVTYSRCQPGFSSLRRLNSGPYLRLAAHRLPELENK